MGFLRRTSLVAIVLVAPPFAIAILYATSIALLHATHRMIEPQILWYSAAIELPVFLFLSVLEARNRW